MATQPQGPALLPLPELDKVLSDQHELFALAVASGRSYRQASILAGFHESWGFQVMRMPAVRAKISEILLEPAGSVRAGIDLEITMLRNAAAAGPDEDERAQIELRLRLLMSHAKLRGWIVEKKQTSHARMDLGKVSPAELRELLGSQLASLDPAAADRVKGLLAPAATVDSLDDD